MRRFTQLFQQIDATTSTNAKVAALQAYFATESPANAVWAIHLFLGKTRRRRVTSRSLREIFLTLSDLPEWLFQDCYSQVGDTSEVIALLLPNLNLPPQERLDLPLHVWMETVIPQVKDLNETELRDRVASWWAALDPFEVFVLNKILTGAFRVGVSSKLLIRALAQVSEVSEAVLTHRLMGEFTPTPAFYQQLLAPDEGARSPSQPYPFFLASPLDEAKFSAEADLAEWQAEWKWDGIRAQVIKRADEVFIWSRGEDLITPQFPEVAEAAQALANGTVLDGEILGWDYGRDCPLNFNALQKRLGRKRVTAKLRQEQPVRFIGYDLLEQSHHDVRSHPLHERRSRLIDVLTSLDSPVLVESEPLEFATFAELQTWRSRSRPVGAEGLMLKALASPYLVGRKRGYWWKYKIEPMTLDAVLIYAQAGSGKRANLFTDYTFALWTPAGELVPFAKAYSGLDNAEINRLDRWIRRHTTERFGPVRSVEPLQVFEIGFEGIARSSRHKSGISVRFPRILRWRTDKPASEADTLHSAIALLDSLPIS